MKWLKNYELVLFDFDGLLVNTEHLHFKAYKLMCEKRGCSLVWDFEKFCSLAHRNALGLQSQIYSEFPSLRDTSWDVLYREKKLAYQALLEAGGMELMPGVKGVLQFLSDQGVNRAVVTNSAREQIEKIKEHLPLLQSIPHWFTRETYKNPKPAPDGYLKALATLARQGDRVIGFEDTLRGISSLQDAGIEGVLVSSCLSDEFKVEIDKKKVPHVQSFEELSVSPFPVH